MAMVIVGTREAARNWRDRNPGQECISISRHADVFTLRGRTGPLTVAIAEGADTTYWAGLYATAREACAIANLTLREDPTDAGAVTPQHTLR